jgi:hypothetical protein
MRTYSAIGIGMFFFMPCGNARPPATGLAPRGTDIAPGPAFHINGHDRLRCGHRRRPFVVITLSTNWFSGVLSTWATCATKKNPGVAVPPCSNLRSVSSGTPASWATSAAVRVPRSLRNSLPSFSPCTRWIFDNAGRGTSITIPG